jgi:hypothetical protein
VLVTPKVTVQFPLAGIVMPVKFTTGAPAVKTLPAAPPHDPADAPPTAVIFESVSENEAFVNAVALLLVKVNVTVEVPPDAIVVGENAFPMVGGAITVMLAVAVAPAPSSVVES